MQDTPVTLPVDMSGYPIHFVGIKGTGMAALVEICARRGAVITGSDVSERFYTDEILEKLGIRAVPFSESNITGAEPKPRLVIYSSAYKPSENPDLIAAQKVGIPCILYTEGLGAISRTAYSAGICGVHGKTTTTGIAGTLIRSLGLSAQVLAGSVITSFGNSCTLTVGEGAPQFFVAETCEYQRHFLSFAPQKILLTSVESDHQDYYPTYGDILDAFIDYICLLPPEGTLIYCADDPGACEAANAAMLERPDLSLIPYGEYAPGAFGITFGKIEDGRQHFQLTGFDIDFALKIPGHHTVLDAAGAIVLVLSLLYEERQGGQPVFASESDPETAELASATGSRYPKGVRPPEEDFTPCTADALSKVVTDRDLRALADGLLEYAGAKRRTELVGEAVCMVARTSARADGEGASGSGLEGGAPRAVPVTILDDYGHHPTAIKTTLQGYKSFYPDRVLIVSFMSHTYTRTAALLEEFAGSFGAADHVILHKIYGSARETYIGGVTGETLAAETKKRHPNVTYIEDPAGGAAVDEVLRRLGEPLPAGKTGYLFVTMGAGNNDALGRAVLERLTRSL